MHKKKFKLLYFVLICIVIFCYSCTEEIQPTIPQTAEVTINISTTDGGSLVGTKVILENHNGTNIYQRTATEKTIILPIVEYGTYTVIAQNSRYEDFLYSPLIVQSKTVSHTVYLFTGEISKGDFVYFGGFEWYVLDINNGKALIITSNVVDLGRYNTSNVNTTWENSSLRSYLNGTFYDSLSLANKDREKIIPVTNETENNQWFGTNGGNATLDYIFLLSLSEVVKYFGDSGLLENRPNSTTYWISDEFDAKRVANWIGVATHWWLRSPGNLPINATRVGANGSIYMVGENVDNYMIGIRPALWLQLPPYPPPL